MIRGGDGIRDDTGFFKRELFGKMLNILGRDTDIFGKSAVNMISEHDHVHADVLPTQAAVFTVAAGKDRGDEHSITNLEVFCFKANFLDYARSFMAQDNGRLFESGNTVVYIMQISVADTAGCDFYLEIARAWLRSFDLFNDQRLIGLMKNGCSHFFLLYLFFQRGFLFSMKAFSPSWASSVASSSLR
jgi:hypothetical protein